MKTITENETKSKAKDEERSKQLVRFGNMIRAKRKEKHLTVEELAEKVNLSDRGLRDIESGRADPHIMNVLRICSYCEIDVGELSKIL